MTFCPDCKTPIESLLLKFHSHAAGYVCEHCGSVWLYRDDGALRPMTMTDWGHLNSEERATTRKAQRTARKLMS